MCSDKADSRLVGLPVVYDHILTMVKYWTNNLLVIHAVVQITDE